MSPSGHQWAWDVWRVKALLVLACSSLLLAATCQLPGTTPPTQTGGTLATGGAPSGGIVATGGQVELDAGADASETVCRWVPSGRTTRRVEAVRIVGGNLASQGKWPAVVALETTSGFQFCGGTVIAPRRVFTAAHCQPEPGEIVHGGTVDLREPGVKAMILEARNNPEWYGTVTGNDASVLVLDRDIGLPAVPLSTVEHTGWAWTVGWGATCEGCSTVPLQRDVAVKLVPRSECIKSYPWQLNSTMLCAGGAGSDSCQGDSGGPLFVDVDGTWELEGGVSWGIGCGEAPGVYTSVPSMREWIEACAK